MSTNFPSNLDSFVNPTGTDQVSVIDHAAQHDNANDAITALETKVGVDSSSVATTLDYKLKNALSIDPGHKHTQSSLSTTDAGLTTTDVTTNDVTSAKHGFAPKSPADATKFLNGAATPAYAQVKDSDLSTTDITTNNVSTSKHGFAPKLDNIVTHYLDGTGVYSTPPTGTLTNKNATTTYDLSTASGVQTIAHGLGRTPGNVQLNGVSNVGIQNQYSQGGYDGTTNACIFGNVDGATRGNSNSVGVQLGSSTNYQAGVITVDATNITITWTKTGSPTGTIYLYWRVF